MSYASTVLPLFPAADVRPVLATLRLCGQVAGGALQTLGFAAVVWLLLAGPGFLADTPGSAPAVHASHR